MLTNEQEHYFFRLCKAAYYSHYKQLIEKIYDNIEKPETRTKRDRMLEAADQYAEEMAHGIVLKIKNDSIEELNNNIKSAPENFGNKLLNEIKSELAE